MVRVGFKSENVMENDIVTPAASRWYVYSDGGRAEAGFKGTTNDCVCRAIAIASGLPYKWVYDRLNVLAKEEKPSKRRHSPKKSSARNGVHRVTYDKLLKELGFVWVPLCRPGQPGPRLDPANLPKRGRLILRLSKHLAAFVDGTLCDIYDCSRGATRMVYGYWIAPRELPGLVK